MIGGFNKLLRNLASLKGKSEFEKRLIKASYSGDMKEPKEKHLSQCLKGKHIKLVRPKEGLDKLFDRFFNNLKSISLMLKALCILHRSLQEEGITQMVARKIKEKENLLYPCQTEDQSYDAKMQNFICELYIDYIKNLINFIIICQLFSIHIKDLHHYTKTLQVKELFLIFSRIDGLIENILKLFEQKTYCQGFRLLHSIIYLLFVDLLKIYQSYYILITVMLERFDEMQIKDAKRAFIIYLNFIKVNKEIRKMATCILQEFNINLNILFYDVDTKLIEAMKTTIDLKEKEKTGGQIEESPYSNDSKSASSQGKEILISAQTPRQEMLTEEKQPKQQLLEIQGQGMQGKKHSPILKNRAATEQQSPDSINLELPQIGPFKRQVSHNHVRFEDRHQITKNFDNLKQVKSEIFRHQQTEAQRTITISDSRNNHLPDLDQMLLSPEISPKNKKKISEIEELDEESQSLSDDSIIEPKRIKTQFATQEDRKQHHENESNFFESSIYYDVKQDQFKKLQRAGTNNEDKFFQMGTMKFDSQTTIGQFQMQRKISGQRTSENGDEIDDEMFHSFLN